MDGLRIAELAQLLDDMAHDLDMSDTLVTSSDLYYVANEIRKAASDV